MLATYEGARGVYVAMLRGETDLDTAGEELEAYATGQAYESLLQDGRTFSEAGIVFEGEPGMDPEVTGVDMDATPAQATLTDCWDTTNWQPLRNGTPLEKAPDQNQRQVLNMRAEHQDDGAWLLTELAPEEGRTC
ncbi:hypothetical protein ABZ249_16270 [Nocardiopsis sp. NPDC006139]|uniref:hypothetical protein n=1 Tax=Nocardiopsis sp. NPDC006139 TaxID=3154578 RepID=UPI0033B72380